MARGVPSPRGTRCEKRCAWLFATRPINLTPADTKLVGFGPQRKQLSLAPLIKIAREPNDIEINTAVL